MGRIMKRFADGSFLEFDHGRFDDWCVYFTDTSGHRGPPHDTGYFSQLKALADRFGAGKVYDDFVKIYDVTEAQVSGAVLRGISRLAGSYGAYALQADTVFSTLYLAMIAEEEKEGTHLGKRIKRLGVHKLLMENGSVRDSATFMKRMRWYKIARLCEERGF